ncbi:MAG TPA: hypothetical protein EYM87_01455, partial [Candidatus Marinimicrobia bacterium]|nr:hypothetical protein [Candidatus Neomarinimicrobiota bacterium]
MRRLLPLFIIFSAFATAQVSVVVSVDKKKINQSQYITFEVQVEGSDGFPQVDLSVIKDFAIAGGPSQSSSYQMYNNKVTTAFTLSWNLRPKKNGKLLIPSLKVKVDGKNYSTKPISIQVSKSPKSRSQRKQQPEPETEAAEEERFAEEARLAEEKAAAAKAAAAITVEEAAAKAAEETRLAEEAVAKAAEETRLTEEARLAVVAVVARLAESKAKAPPGSPWNFNNAGATGRLGPTQAQVNTAYTGTTLEDKVMITTQGIQEWTVPATGAYRIEAWGAQGGTGDGGSTSSGNGARIKGDFQVNQGDILNIVIGQKGSNGPSSQAGGGGGGSFVYTGSIGGSGLLIAAGGGGGAGEEGSSPATGGSTGTSGLSSGSGESGGNWGNPGSSANDGHGAGGAGWNRSASHNCGGQHWSGGDCGYYGGFGGGGGCPSDGGGGAGGYSGGAGGRDEGYYGGGGGSYNAGTNQSNSSGVNIGHGKVIITYLQEPSVYITNVQVR